MLTGDEQVWYCEWTRGGRNRRYYTKPSRRVSDRDERREREDGGSSHSLAREAVYRAVPRSKLSLVSLVTPS